MKGQKLACEQVTKWHERFGWGTDIAHAAGKYQQLYKSLRSLFEDMMTVRRELSSISL